MSETALKIPGRGREPQAKWRFLAESRVRLGLGQGQIAALCGVKQPQVSDWETGKDTPTFSQISSLAKALQVGVGEVAEQADIFFNKNTT